MKATRESYGLTLAELGETNKDIVVLDADLSGSTKTAIFGKKFPERFFNCGIAEGNMMSVAAGLAACGKTVFASSFAMFATGRAFEQIRNSICYPGLNVKIAASHAGVSVGEDGATHQCNEDIALMRTIPGLTLIVPADDTQAHQAVRAAMDIEGPVYLRFSRMASPVIFDKSEPFTVGKAQTVREGTDVTIITCGILVAEAIKAHEQLKSEGISARVINMHTVKPVDRAAITAAAKETGAIVTAEEHTTVGGLGSAVCDVVCEEYPVPVIKMGVNDVFGFSASADYMLDYFNLRAEGMVKSAKQAIAKK